jgi:hypothetical protein
MTILTTKVMLCAPGIDLSHHLSQWSAFAKVSAAAAAAATGALP